MKTTRKVGWAVLIGTLCLSSCEKFSTTSPTFEIRDFSVEGERKTYGSSVSSMIYTGRGTIIATPKGNYLVWIRARNLTRATEGQANIVIVTDGTGVLNISEYVTDAPKDLQPPKYKWELIGYMPMLPGTLVIKE